MNEVAASGPSVAAEWERPVLLREARESTGLHIAALAAALKVPVKKLEALESGNYHDLPDMTFARALASSACRHLKIDPAPVLAQIPLGHAAVLGDTSSTINAPFKAARLSPSLPLADALKRPAVLIAAGLVLAAVGVFFMPDLRPLMASLVDAVSTTPAPRVMASKDSPTTDPVALEAAPRDAGETVSPTPSAAVLTGGVQVLPEPAGQATGDEGLLVLKATGDSWVEVIDGAGVSQVQRMFKTGDVLSFSATPPYSVVLGRADQVQVTVRGLAFDVSPHARNSVARFQVK
jgi:cytoskeleton protein RodZ